MSARLVEGLALAIARPAFVRLGASLDRGGQRGGGENDPYCSGALQFQQTSNDDGFSSPHFAQRSGGPAVERRYSSISPRARSASAGFTTQIWGSEASIGSSPARLEAFALKMRARTPRSARWSATSCASGRLVAV